MNKRFVELAIEEAKKSIYEQRMGCIIFNKKIIISSGHNYALKNRKRLNPKFQKWKGSIHAEVDAILNAKSNLKNCHLLIIRINKKNEFRLALPCNKCRQFIEHVGIKKVFYSINTYPHIIKLKEF